MLCKYAMSEKLTSMRNYLRIISCTIRRKKNVVPTFIIKFGKGDFQNLTSLVGKVRNVD